MGNICIHNDPWKTGGGAFSFRPPYFRSSSLKTCSAKASTTPRAAPPDSTCSRAVSHGPSRIKQTPPPPPPLPPPPPPPPPAAATTTTTTTTKYYCLIKLQVMFVDMKPAGPFVTLYSLRVEQISTRYHNWLVCYQSDTLKLSNEAN